MKMTRGPHESDWVDRFGIGAYSKTAAFLGIWAWTIVQMVAGGFSREINRTLRFPERAPQARYHFVQAFAPLTFQQPTAIVAPLGESNQMFILEKPGRIQRVSQLNQPQKSLFLDFASTTDSSDLESGALGLAFHPGFSTNRQFFVYRTRMLAGDDGVERFHDVLSRFEADPRDPTRASPESEVVVFAHPDFDPRHNAGDVQFGPDGYLYLTVGDTTPDSLLRSPNTKQPIDQHHFGAILRIDVDGRPGSLQPNPHPGVISNYRIPADNPFVHATEYHGRPVLPGNICTELYAIGFRNPWKMSFDSKNRTMYVGDVGSVTWEEVNRVMPGGNYGWPYFEGHESNVGSRTPVGFQGLPPVVAYHHGNATNEGNCVILGPVYYGSQIPGLQGHLIFGDLSRGHVWALKSESGGTQPVWSRIAASPGISCFGTDPRQGDVLVADFGEGQIRRLVASKDEAMAGVPNRLSETGAFADMKRMTPQPGIFPYEVNQPFWSDHAAKQRWFAILSNSDGFDFAIQGPWGLPSRAVWIKHFEIQTNLASSTRHRLETRFLIKTPVDLYGVTYRWREDGSDADLVPPEGSDKDLPTVGFGGERSSQVWHFPNHFECRTCHNEAAGKVLGFDTAQLNLMISTPAGPRNQLAELRDAGLFRAGGEMLNGTDLPKVAQLSETDTAIHERARSYLAVNCASCHVSGPSQFFAQRWLAPLHLRTEELGLLNTIHNYVVPGDPDGSRVLHRMAGEFGLGRMPPIGTHVQDIQGMALIRQWIGTLPPAPWRFRQLGTSIREGSAAFMDRMTKVTGYGRPPGVGADDFFWLSRPIGHAGYVTARVLSSSDSEMPDSALMIRSDVDNGAVFLGIAPSRNGTIHLWSRNGAGVFWHQQIPGAVGARVRIVSEGHQIRAQWSGLGTNWQVAAEGTLPEASAHTVGIAAWSTSAGLRSTTDWQLDPPVQIQLVAPEEGRVGELGEPIAVTASVDFGEGPAPEVEFVANDLVIGKVLGPPYSMNWKPVAPGHFRVSARIVEGGAASVSGSPRSVQVLPPQSRVLADSIVRAPGGDWTALWPDARLVVVTNVAASNVSVEGAAVVKNTQYLGDPRSSLGVGGEGRIDRVWSADKDLFVDVDLPHDEISQIILHLVDRNGGGLPVNIVCRDGNTGMELGSWLVENLKEGVFIPFWAKGRISYDILPTGGSIELSAVILESPRLPDAAIISTIPSAAEVTLPEPVRVQSRVRSPFLTGAYVDYIADDRIVGRGIPPTFATTMDALENGTNTIKAVFTDGMGRVGAPLFVQIVAHPPVPAARWESNDAITKGDWIGTHGRDGWLLFGNSTNLPSYVDVTIQDAGVFRPGEVDFERIYPAMPGEVFRSVSMLLAFEPFHIDVLLRDGFEHKVSFYIIDHGDRRSRVELLDPETGLVRDTRVVEGFVTGEYVSYLVRGRARFRFVPEVQNLIISALFIDPVPGGFREWIASPPSFADQRDPISSGPFQDPDGDGFSNAMEFLLGGDPLTADPQWPRITLSRSGTSLQIEWRAHRAHQPLLGLEMSADLNEWQVHSGPVIRAPTAEEGVDSVTVTQPLQPAGLNRAGARFFRLRIPDNSWD